MIPQRSSAEIIAVPHERCEKWRALLSKYDWNLDTAFKIMFAESECFPDAENHANKNESNDKGLMQINSIHCEDKIDCTGSDQRLNPEANVATAFQIYKNAGDWSPWSTCNSKVKCIK